MFDRACGRRSPKVQETKQKNSTNNLPSTDVFGVTLTNTATIAGTPSTINRQFGAQVEQPNGGVIFGRTGNLSGAVIEAEAESDLVPAGARMTDGAVGAPSAGGGWLDESHVRQPHP